MGDGSKSMVFEIDFGTKDNMNLLMENGCIANLWRGNEERIAAKSFTKGSDSGIIHNFPDIYTMIVFVIVVIAFICWTQWIYGYGERDMKSKKRARMFREFQEQYGHVEMS